jgi:hypothetical protein
LHDWLKIFPWPANHPSWISKQQPIKISCEESGRAAVQLRVDEDSGNLDWELFVVPLDHKPFT